MTWNRVWWSTCGALALAWAQGCGDSPNGLDGGSDRPDAAVVDDRDGGMGSEDAGSDDRRDGGMGSEDAGSDDRRDGGGMMGEDGGMSGREAVELRLDGWWSVERQGPDGSWTTEVVLAASQTASGEELALTVTEGSARRRVVGETRTDDGTATPFERPVEGAVGGGPGGASGTRLSLLRRDATGAWREVGMPPVPIDESLVARATERRSIYCCQDVDGDGYLRMNAEIGLEPEVSPDGSEIAASLLVSCDVAASGAEGRCVAAGDKGESPVFDSPVFDSDLRTGAAWTVVGPGSLRPASSDGSGAPREVRIGAGPAIVAVEPTGPRLVAQRDCPMEPVDVATPEPDGILYGVTTGRCVGEGALLDVGTFVAVEAAEDPATGAMSLAIRGLGSDPCAGDYEACALAAVGPSGGGSGAAESFLVARPRPDGSGIVVVARRADGTEESLAELDAPSGARTRDHLIWEGQDVDGDGRFDTAITVAQFEDDGGCVDVGYAVARRTREGLYLLEISDISHRDGRPGRACLDDVGILAGEGLASFCDGNAACAAQPWAAVLLEEEDCGGEPGITCDSYALVPLGDATGAGGGEPVFTTSLRLDHTIKTKNTGGDFRTLPTSYSVDSAGGGATDVTGYRAARGYSRARVARNSR